MKNKIYLSTLFAALFSFMFCESGFAQTQTADYYNVKSGTGKGLRLWSSDNYKIHMGATSVYKYGPVTNYSIKMNMNNNAARGWTWGVLNTTPVAALNTQGNFQIKGWMKNMSRYYYFGDTQRLYGDNASALHWTSNHSTATQIILRDKENTIYGRVYGSGNGVNFGLLDGDANWSYRAVKDTYTLFLINNSEKMRIRNDGNVGIGTTNPLNKLQVADAFSFHDGGHEIIGFGYAPGANVDLNSAGYASEIRLDPANGLFRIGISSTKTNAPTTHLTIKSNGNVGIGTITPDNKLDVNGIIRSKEVKVESGWSDYVFYDDYQLPTLEAEEKHIEENGHLLGFESEKAMNGEIQLGDISRRQQAKIEEIVLHLIDMKKEMTQLKEENEELKKLLKAEKE